MAATAGHGSRLGSRRRDRGNAGTGALPVSMPGDGVSRHDRVPRSTLLPGGDDLLQVRAALIASAATPWRHDRDAEDETRKLAISDADRIAFVRDAGDGVEAAGLFLWSKNGGNEVTNIVPRETASLGESGYNTVLRDFMARVVEPAAAWADFRIAVNTPEQTLDDCCRTLPHRRYVVLRDGEQGDGLHPSARSRTLATFLIAVHGAGPPLAIDLSKRRLVEDGWTEDGAQELTGEYEFGLALLGAYDRERT